CENIDPEALRVAWWPRGVRDVARGPGAIVCEFPIPHQPCPICLLGGTAYSPPACKRSFHGSCRCQAGATSKCRVFTHPLGCPVVIPAAPSRPGADLRLSPDLDAARAPRVPDRARAAPPLAARIVKTCFGRACVRCSVSTYPSSLRHLVPGTRSTWRQRSRTLALWAASARRSDPATSFGSSGRGCAR